MDENKTNDSAKETESNDFNKDWYYSMLNLCNTPSSNDEDKNKDDLWWKLFPLLFTFANQPQNNVILEKEVAYMRGRLDVLEKVVIESKKRG